MKNKKAFTLIEVLTASLLLSISIGSVLYSFIIHERITYDNSYRREAYVILQSKMEDYINMGGELLEIDLKSGVYPKNGVFEASAAGKHKYILNFIGKKALTFKNILNKNGRYIKLTGSVSWISASGGNEIVDLSTYIIYNTAE